jgi:aspartate racemase
MDRPLTIGILEGMGPRSTSPFLEAVLDECERQYGARTDGEYPHMLAYSLPTPFYPDRPVDHEELRSAVVAGAKRLAAATVREYLRRGDRAESKESQREERFP